MYRLQQNVVRDKLSLLIFNEALTQIKKIVSIPFRVIFSSACKHHLLSPWIFKPGNFVFLEGLENKLIFLLQIPYGIYVIYSVSLHSGI